MATTLLYASGAPSGRIQKADEMRTLLIERLANFVYPKVPRHRRQRMYEYILDTVHEKFPKGIALDIGAQAVYDLERELSKQADILANAPSTPPRRRPASASSLFGNNYQEKLINEAKEKTMKIRKTRKQAQRSLNKVGTTAPPSLMRLRQELFETARKFTEKQQQQQQHNPYPSSVSQSNSLRDEEEEEETYTNNYPSNENADPAVLPFPSTNTTTSYRKDNDNQNILTKSFRKPDNTYTITGGATKVAITDPREVMGIVQLGKDTIPSGTPSVPPPPSASRNPVPQGNHLDNIKGSAIVAYNTCLTRLQQAETKLRLKQQEHQHAQWETERQIQFVPSKVPSEARMAIKGAKMNEEKVLLVRRRLEADVEAARLDLLHAQERLDLALGIAANDNAGALSAEFRAKVREEELRKQQQIMGIKTNTNTKTSQNSTTNFPTNTTTSDDISAPLHNTLNYFPSSSTVNPKLTAKQNQYHEIAEQIGHASIKLQQRVHQLEKDLSTTRGNSIPSFYNNLQDIDPALATYPIPPSVLHGTGGELSYAQRRQRRPQENAWQEAAIREATEARAMEIANLAIRKEQTKNAFIELARYNLEMGETAPDSSVINARPPVPPREPPPRTYVPPPVPRLPPPPPPPVEELPVEEQYIMEPIKPAGAPSGAIDQLIRQREQSRIQNLSKRTNKWFSSSAIWDSMNHDQAYNHNGNDNTRTKRNSVQEEYPWYPNQNDDKDIHPQTHAHYPRSSSKHESTYPPPTANTTVPEPIDYSHGTLVQAPYYAPSLPSSNVDHQPYSYPTDHTVSNKENETDDQASSVYSANEQIQHLDNYIRNYDNYEQQQFHHRIPPERSQQPPRVTIVPPSVPVPPSRSTNPATGNSTAVQTNEEISPPSISSVPLPNNNTKIINATLTTAKKQSSSSYSVISKTTSNNPSSSSSHRKQTSLDFLYNGSIAGLPPMRKPTIRQTKPNEWLPAPSANTNPLGPKVMGMQRGETAKGNSTTEDIEKLLARPSVRGGMKKGGSGDHTFPRYGVVDIVPGVPPTKPKKGKIKMVANAKPSRLGPKPKLFDWKWPDQDKQHLKPGSAEDTAYWRSMSQPKRYLKPAWARDPKGPKEQYW